MNPCHFSNAKKAIFSIIALMVCMSVKAQETITTTKTTLNDQSWGHWWKGSPDRLTSLLSVIILTIATIATYTQWLKTQKWKRKEMLLSLMTAFNNAKGARNALLLLWDTDREIALWDKSDRGQMYEFVKKSDVIVALAPADILPYVDSRHEYALRDSFNDLINRLVKLYHMAKDGLVETEDIEEFFPGLKQSLLKRRGATGDDRIVYDHFILHIASSNLCDNKQRHRVFELFKEHFGIIITADDVKQSLANSKDYIASQKLVRTADVR